MSFLDQIPPDDPWEKEFYEPLALKREWYRHQTTGERGWRVRRNGKTQIRYDRGPNIDTCVPFNKSVWAPLKELRPLTDHHLAEVAYAADQVLLRALGDHEYARTPWINLRDSERIDWKDSGPGQDGDPVRVDLFRAIMKTLEHLKA
jgi:hypothetical protein